MHPQLRIHLYYNPGRFVDQLRLPTVDDSSQTANGSITVSIEPGSGSIRFFIQIHKQLYKFLTSDDIEVSIDNVSSQKVRLNHEQS